MLGRRGAPGTEGRPVSGCLIRFPNEAGNPGGKPGIDVLGLDEVSDRGDEAAALLEGEAADEVGMIGSGGGDDLGEDEVVLLAEVTPRGAVDVIGGGVVAGLIAEAALDTTKLSGDDLAASSGGRGSFSKAARFGGGCNGGCWLFAFSGLVWRFKCISSLSLSVNPCKNKVEIVLKLGSCSYTPIALHHPAIVPYLVAQIAVKVGSAFELAKRPPAGLLFRLGAVLGVGSDREDGLRSRGQSSLGNGGRRTTHHFLAGLKQFGQRVLSGLAAPRE